MKWLDSDRVTSIHRQLFNFTVISVSNGLIREE